MDGSLPNSGSEVAFITAWAPVPEAVVDLRDLDEAVDSPQTDVIAYLALVHAEVTEIKTELRTLRQSLESIVDLD